jgi:N-dimethylarginine dimethylaminohydrolase
MKVLLCPPTYYSVSYSINPWMKQLEEDVPGAMVQWNILCEKLIELGVEIEYIDPQYEFPDMTFVDCGLVFGHIFIPSNFRYQERQGEQRHYIYYFNLKGYIIKEIDGYFEGHGDSLWGFNNNLFLGHGFRTELKAIENIRTFIGDINPEINIIDVKLIDPRFYHLDTCFCPLSKDTAMIYSPAIDDESIEKIRKSVPVLVEVFEEEALEFVCNSVVLGNNVIMPNCKGGVVTTLKKLGYNVINIPMDGFIKAGGACKCLTFTF